MMMSTLVICHQILSFLFHHIGALLATQLSVARISVNNHISTINEPIFVPLFTIAGLPFLSANVAKLCTATTS